MDVPTVQCPQCGAWVPVAPDGAATICPCGYTISGPSKPIIPKPAIDDPTNL